MRSTSGSGGARRNLGVRWRWWHAGVALFAAVCRSLAEIVKEVQTQVITDHIADVVHGQSVEMDQEYYDKS